MLLRFSREKLCILKNLYFETQESKNSINAHFSKSMVEILFYINEGNNLISPVKFVYALSTYSKLSNSLTELFQMKREHVNKLITKYEEDFKKFNKKINR